MDYKALLTIIAFLVSITTYSWTQGVPPIDVQKAGKINEVLQQEGFQNITVHKNKKGYIIGYENRVYRFEARALKQVIRATTSLLKRDTSELIFVTKQHNVPMISTTLSLAAYNGYQSGLQDFKGFLNDIKVSQDLPNTDISQQLIKNKNTGNYRIELVLRPYLSLELGSFVADDQFIHLIDIRPKFNFYLWKGASFTYEFILPISNEFEESAPQWSEIRSRVMSFTQRVRLPYNTFLNTSLGVFSRERYGVSLELGKYFLNGRLLTQGKVGYTGIASYVRYDYLFDQLEKSWVRTRIKDVDYKVGIRYWFPHRNLQIGLMYGKVLNEKEVVRLDITQKFKEVEIGFFALNIDSGRNYGMNLKIPISPKKYWKPKFFSVRPSRHFEYNYVATVNLAREYQAQGMYGEFPQDLNPAFIKFQMLQGL